MVSLVSAARRTGLAADARGMVAVCDFLGVPVVDGRVDLAAFAGGRVSVGLSGDLIYR